MSQLPFPDSMFDLVTAVDAHFWWPNLPGDMREVFRVLKPGGTLIFIAEIYKGANTMAAKLAGEYASRTGMTLLSVDEHRREGWEVLSMPAIAERDEPYRKAGEALWPERFPVLELELIRRESSGAVWAALYQQRPATAEGSIFKRASGASTTRRRN